MLQLPKEVWKFIADFLREYPAAGVVFLLFPVVWLLATNLGPDSPIGPVVGAVLIIIVLPAVFYLLRAITDHLFANGIVRNLLVYTFGICAAMLMCAGTAFAMYTLYTMAKEPAPLTQEERAIAPVSSDAGPQPEPETVPEAVDDRFLIFKQEPETQTIEIAPTEPVLSDASPPPVAPAPENPDTGYNACINAQHARGNAEGILDCVVLLEG